MFNHCLACITIIVITILNNDSAFIIQCQNCRCIPDYCPQTVPQSLCPCAGPKAPCTTTTSQMTAGMQTMYTDMTNIYQQPYQQPYMVPQAPSMWNLLPQQPVQTAPLQIPSQFMIQGQQQYVQTSGLQTQLLPQQQPQITLQQQPLYIIRTIEQPSQVIQIQQVPEPILSSQQVPSVQQFPLPLQQTQMMIVPSVQQQMISQQQPFISPYQLPLQAITLQVPVTMVESCKPRMNVCPVGLPSIHAVTECNNTTDTSASRCITVEEARKLYTCLPQFNFDKLWDN